MNTKLNQRFDLILIVIVLLAACLNMFNIWSDQTANAYYTSAVTSMLQNFHNFFFASLDPGGFVTVDKPPVTFWIQTISAYIFGVHGWSVILPQALAGVGSVLLMYKLVKPTFGQTAARLTSLIFACTPIAAAVSRTNNVDSLLVFTLVLATWMLFKGIRKEKWIWIIAAFGVIGVAFNMKMLQAYMVLPAFYLFYLLAAKVNWKKKLSVMAVASVVLIVISVSWAVIVDSIPSENRPYIGSSQTNSVLELAFGYNGISRLTGNKGMGGGGPGIPGGPGGEWPAGQQMQSQTNQTRNDGGGLQNGGPGGGPMGDGKGGGGAFNTGQAGPLRLFQSELSGQISWLLPFVGFASVGLLAGIRRRKPLTTKQQETLFWLAWLIPGMVFFSVAGFFHQYYLIMLAPPIAAIAGAGWVELWNQYRNKDGWRTWLLPAAILATTAFELYIITPYNLQIGRGWAIGVGAAGGIVSLILLLAAKKEAISRTAAIAGMLVLLITPLYWAATPLLYGGNSMIPSAGPELKSSSGQGPGGGGNPGMMGRTNHVDTKLVEYLHANQTGEKFLFATAEANTAESYIIKTGEAVMAMGGFSGSDPILTVEKLKQMVDKKQVKYFLLSSGSGFGGGRGGSTEVTTWIKENSTIVPTTEWQSDRSQDSKRSQDDVTGMRAMGNSMTLYKINS